MTLWLEVTTDEYELPVAVADSMYELARIRNVCPTAIFNGIKYHNENKTKGKCKYLKIEVED